MNISDFSSRQARASNLGFTVDGYHGTTHDFAAFRHGRGNHLGFHFGSTPAAAEQKLKNDRHAMNSTVYRGGAAEPMFDPQSRDAAVAVLRQKHKTIQAKLSAIYGKVSQRSMASYHDGGNDLLLGALDAGDEAAIHRLLSAGQAAPSAEEATQVKALQDALNAVDQRISAYYASARPGERILPVKLRLQNPIRMNDTLWSDPAHIANDNRDLKLPHHSLAAICTELQRRGHDGIVYRNQVEDVGCDSYIVFSANQVRSRHANFDPAKRQSGNMMEAADRFKPGSVRSFYDKVAREADMMLGVPADEIDPGDVRGWVARHRKLFTGGPVPVWRVMRLPEASVLALKAGAELGQHWAFELNPENFDGFNLGNDHPAGTPLYVFEAEIATGDVHFPLTVAYNCVFPHENEVFLALNATPALVSVRQWEGGALGKNLRVDLVGARMAI